jgi:hypothetical protein
MVLCVFRLLEPIMWNSSIAEGDVIFCDTGNHCIRRCDLRGNVTTIAGKAGKAGHTDGAASSALFNGPRGIALGPNGSRFRHPNPTITPRATCLPGDLLVWQRRMGA